MAQITTLSPSALPGQAYGSFAGKTAAPVLVTQPGVVTLANALAHSAILTDVLIHSAGLSEALAHSVTVGETQND